MEDKSNLEQYLIYGLNETPQIKEDEKKYWLGEFRERIVFALTSKQITNNKNIDIVEQKIIDNPVDKIILSTSVKNAIISKIMSLAKKYNKDFKSIDSKNIKGDLVLVLCNKNAVNIENVLLNETESKTSEKSTETQNTTEKKSLLNRIFSTKKD